MSERAVSFAVAAGLGLGAVVVYRSAQAIPPSLLDTRFGAGLLPSILAIVLGALAALLALETAIGKPAIDNGASPRRSDFSRFLRPTLSALALGTYILVLQTGRVPFLPLSAFFLFATTIILSGFTVKSAVKASLLAAAASVLVQYLFVEIFSVYLS